MFTLLLESTKEGTTDYGFGFDSYVQAVEAARSWAIEEWDKGNFKEFSNGVFITPGEVIYVERY